MTETNYPVNYNYGGDEKHFDGFATSDKEAMAVSNITSPKGWQAVEACLLTTEAGRVYKTGEEARAVWANEIKAGCCTIIHVWAGFKAEITFWDVVSKEMETI